MGQAKTHLQHVMSATSMNVVRLLRWLTDEPKAKTSYSTFAQLYQITAYSPYRRIRHQYQPAEEPRAGQNNYEDDKPPQRLYHHPCQSC
jgi:hypothetical protein